MTFWNRIIAGREGCCDDGGEARTGGRPLGPARVLVHLLALAMVGSFLLVGVGIAGGSTMVEKLLTALMMPVGLVWLLLLVIVYFCLVARQRWLALIGVVAWLVLTMAGNRYLSNWLVSTLERPYQQIDVLAMEPFDAIVVLGGGTDSRINGESQLSTAGDRIATAARMYHARRVGRLICTGSNAFQGSPLDLPPREEAAEVLVDLGVPSDRVIQLEGKNTSEEMTNLHAWLDTHQDCRRVGLLTSAYHLPRAIRLARSRGLELVPVPSDFLTEPFAPSPHLVVPGTDHLNTTHRALKEYLAWWVGR